MTRHRRDRPQKRRGARRDDSAISNMSSPNAASLDGPNLVTDEEDGEYSGLHDSLFSPNDFPPLIAKSEETRTIPLLFSLDPSKLENIIPTTPTSSSPIPENGFLDREEILLKLAKSATDKPKLKPKKLANAIFTQFQDRVRTAFEKARKSEPEKRTSSYEQLSFLDVFDELLLSIYRVRALVDCVLELVVEQPLYSTICAEFYRFQLNSLPAHWKKCFHGALLRSLRVRFTGADCPHETLEVRRKRRFIYAELLGHFFNVSIVTSSLIEKYVLELFEAKVNEESDMDSLTYLVRLLSIIGWKWDMGGHEMRHQLTVWFCCLDRIVNCPPPLKYDVDRLLSMRPQGFWAFGSFCRSDHFETRLPFDNVIFHTVNSFGRCLHASSEVLAMYSPYFYKFFYTDGLTLLSERHEVFISVEFYVFREILSILYNIGRVYTVIGHPVYDTASIVQLYRAAKDLDIPLVLRMCKEQLAEKPPLEAALVGQELQLKEIVSNALRWMSPDDMRLFMEYGDRDSTLSARDVFIAVKKFVGLPYRRLTAPPKQEENGIDGMFPPDFHTPWPLGNLTVRTWNSRGRFIYANATILSMYSGSFARKLDELSLKSCPESLEVYLDMDFDLLTMILQIIHHVERKFSYGGHQLYVISTLLRIFKASWALEMPILTKLCEDQLRSMPSSDHLSMAQQAGVPKEIIDGSSGAEQLIDEIRRAVRLSVTSSKAKVSH